MSDFRETEQQIEEAMRAHHVPGLAVAAVQGGEMVYARGFGVASVETGQPVTADTLFRIGSITKSLTATAVMRLVQEGRLDLDRPVGDYVSGLRFSDEQAGPRITLRRLLSHSAGLPTDHNPYGPRHPGALAEYVLNDVPRYRFVAPPGKLYAYSNPGPRIAGHVLQVVGGRPYTDMMRRLVLEPLGMDRTTFDPTVAMTYPLAQAHDLDPDDGVLRVRHRYADDASGYPSGFAISTVLDLCRFARMQLAGGRLDGRQVLSPQSAAEMQAEQVDRLTTAGGGYGLGLALDSYRGLRRASHNGSIGTFGSRIALLPAAGVAVVLLANRAAGFWGTLEHIVDALLDDLLGLHGPPPPPTTIEPDRVRWPLITGTYLGDWVGLAAIGAQGSELMLDWNGTRVPLQAHRDDVYFGYKPGSGELVTVGGVDEGRLPVRYVQINSSPAGRYSPDTAFVPRPETWAPFAGRYTGTEDLTVRLTNGRLDVYSADEGREVECVPLGRDRFACEFGLLDFRQAPDGTVPELVFGRVYRLARRA